MTHSAALASSGIRSRIVTGLLNDSSACSSLRNTWVGSEWNRKRPLRTMWGLKNKRPGCCLGPLRGFQSHQDWWQKERLGQRKRWKSHVRMITQVVTDVWKTWIPLRNWGKCVKNNGIRSGSLLRRWQSSGVVSFSGLVSSTFYADHGSNTVAEGVREALISLRWSGLRKKCLSGYTESSVGFY